MGVIHRLYHYESTGEMQTHILKMRELVARQRAGAECL